MIEKTRHLWKGQHDPDWNPSPYKTFSVGIFEGVKRGNGDYKRAGKVKVRISGLKGNADAVYDMADIVARQLDQGKYTGSRRIRG